MFTEMDISSTLLRTLSSAGLGADVGIGPGLDVGTGPGFEVDNAPVCTGAGGTNRFFFAALLWRS